MPKTFTDSKGNPTNAIYGFALTLIRVIEDLKPEYIVCSFDLAGPTFRHHKFEDYKATRVKADQELYDQIPVIKQLVETFGIPILEMQGYEADDIIGTVAKKITNHKYQISNKSQITNSKSQTSDLSADATPQALQAGEEIKQSNNNVTTYIVTGDKDTFQLVNGDVFVYDLKQGANGPRIINRDVIKTKYDLEPEDFIDLKALAGDASDNIPGVPGIGDKTATTLIKRYGDLDSIYKAIEKLESPDVIARSQTTRQSKKDKDCHDPSGLAMTHEEDQIKPRIKELLIKHKDQAYLSHELATIHKDVPIEFTLEDLKWGEYDRENLRRLFESLGFRSLIARFGRANDAKGSIKIAQQKPPTEIQKKDQQLKLL
jgi:DNA polymerase-1